MGSTSNDDDDNDSNKSFQLRKGLHWKIKNQN